MKKIIRAGATDQTIDLFIQDSASTTGGGKTGLAYNTASLTCYYRKGATGTATALTLATQTVGGAHSDGGFVEIDATNMPGMYRLDLSDTIVATAGSVTLMLKGASGMAPLPIELQVVAVNLEDSVRMGLTALPNAAADAAGGLPISDAGGLDLDARLDVAVSSRLATSGYTAPLDAAGVRTAVGLASANLDTQLTAIDDYLDTEVAAIKAKTDNLPSDPADQSVVNAATDAILAAVSALNDLSAADVRTAVGLASANLDTQLADLPTNAELSAALASADDAVLAAIAALNNLSAADVRGAVGLASANLDTQLADLPTNAELTAALAAADDAVLAQIALVKAKTDLIPASPAAVGSAMTLTSGERDSIAAALLDLANAIETGLTLRQALRVIAAAGAGKLSGAASTTVVIRNAQADSKDRITATVDADGNRSAVTLDLT